MLLILPLVKEWLHIRNVNAVAPFLCGGSCCSDTSVSPLPVELPQVLESTLFDNPLKLAVIPPHPSVSFPLICSAKSQPSAMTFFGLTSFLESINDHHQVNSQLSSLLPV